MSARRRYANKLLVSLTLAFTTGCAHGRVPRSGPLAVYENARDARITLTLETITIGGVAHPLTDCSDADHICRTSDIGFHVSFPRRCPPGSWAAREGPMKYASGIGTSFAALYINWDRSIFVYHWEPRHGLVSIIYDPATDFAALPSISTYRFNGPTEFWRRSGARLFACA